MEAALLYLLKAHAVLALFAAAYYGLLRRLTFFRLNRAYLLLALLFAAVYPALPMPGLLPAVAPTPAAAPATWVLTEMSAAPHPAAALPAESSFSWVALGLLVYAAGAGLLLARLLVQLLALARLRRAARPACTAAGVPYRELSAPGDPFSFGRTIYLHAGQHSEAELAVVLAHEQAHVRQGHTLDVLLAHLGTALFWASPAAWLLRRAVLDNLEYLADAATLRTGLDRRAYQYCLLQLSRSTAGPALALPFTFFTLKNRVAMMNTPLSSRGQLARYFLAGPLVVLAALGYSAAHARSAEPTAASTASLAGMLAAAPEAVAVQPASLPVAAPIAAAKKPANKAKKATSPALPLAVRPALAATPKPGALPAKAAQTGPTPLYYLDGQAITDAQFKAIKPADIASIQVLKGEQASQIAGDKGRDGVIVITTNANKDTPLVIEFNKRVQRVAPLHAEAGTFLVGNLPADALYYLDGKPSTKQAVEQLAQQDLAHVVVLSDQASIRRLPGLSDNPATSVILLTTKANADTPAVRAFAEQADLASGYTFRPVGVNVLVPAALAYITSHYPNARLNEVKEQKSKTTGAVKYQVQLINGKRPFIVYFTPQGEFAGE